MATTYYTDVAFEQQPFLNYPGGGVLPQGSTNTLGQTAQFNDPALEVGNVREVTAIYKMTGNEVANDIVNIYLAQPGSIVSPVGNVSGSGIATTATLNIGDDDTQGYGIVTTPSQTGTPAAASATRYASGINVATGQTNPVQFAGGDALVDPHIIGTLAIEPAGSSPGAGIAGAWVQAKFATLATPVAGKVLVFRLRITKP